MTFSPSKARESVLALAMRRQEDGADDEAKTLRVYARAGHFRSVEDVRDRVAAVVGPDRATELAREICE